jgi:hypothetical protein
VFVQSPSELVEFVEKFGHKASPYGVYFGVCKREREDGTKKSIERVPALWADVDTVKNGWDTDEMVKRIHAVPGVLRPSACIRSGGGLHLYWFLDDPYEVVEHGDVKHVEEVGALLRDIFAGDAVQNIDRILRAPLSWNTKRKPAKQVTVAWCYDFDRKNFFALHDAALHEKKWIGVDGNWGNKGVVLKNTRPAPANPLAAYDQAYGDGKRRANKSIDDMWTNRVRYHAPRGYIGIHEAALQHTATLYIALPEMHEAAVVEAVMRRIQDIKDRDAPDEQWDMGKEADTVLAMYRSWKPKWREYENQRRREREAERKKERGRTGSLRSARR